MFDSQIVFSCSIPLVTSIVTFVSETNHISSIWLVWKSCSSDRTYSVGWATKSQITLTYGFIPDSPIIIPYKIDLNGAFQNYGYPQIIHFHVVFPLKPSIVGYCTSNGNHHINSISSFSHHYPIILPSFSHINSTWNMEKKTADPPPIPPVSPSHQDLAFGREIQGELPWPMTKTFSRRVLKVWPKAS